jgi:hypothetical protein
MRTKCGGGSMVYLPEIDKDVIAQYVRAAKDDHRSTWNATEEIFVYVDGVLQSAKEQAYNDGFEEGKQAGIRIGHEECLDGN